MFAKLPCKIFLIVILMGFTFLVGNPLETFAAGGFGEGGSGTGEGEEIKGRSIKGVFTAVLRSESTGFGVDYFVDLVFIGTCKTVTEPKEKKVISFVASSATSTMNFENTTEEDILDTRFSGAGPGDCYSVVGGEDLVVTDVNKFIHDGSAVYGGKIHLKPVVLTE